MFKTANKEIETFWNAGLKLGGLVVLAARPGMGKTSLLLSIGNEYLIRIKSCEQHKNI